MGSPEFEWARAVYAESRFPAGEKAVVLAHIAIFNVFTGNNTFRVRQSTIAEQCGITRQTVGNAIRQAKRLGFLAVQLDMHTRGRTHHGAEYFSLPLLPRVARRFFTPFSLE